MEQKRYYLSGFELVQELYREIIILLCMMQILDNEECNQMPEEAFLFKTKKEN